ncbi:MAG TPA: hypothetical protein VFB58_17050 [Chloroflexota bacterium]|nr:hypothetical protein [Chloroflexota bacterium]
MNGWLLFAVAHVTVFDAGLAVVVVLGLLYQRRHPFVVCWTLTTSLMVAFSLILGRLASLLYQDPRPQTVIHLAPLRPFELLLPHALTNSFPSAHGILTALIATAVLLIHRRWAIPFIVLAPVILWARAGVALYPLLDTLGAWAVVAAAAAGAAAIGPVITALVLPAVSPTWSFELFRLRHRRLLSQVWQVPIHLLGARVARHH